ncbi:secondary metabolite protein [Streptomyces sp. NPDC092952]|uniref:secondary metabolite protein n=1 Tax=Streptomyces sp. NPDC092952 TaxID=3366018 RepID=UPI0038199B4A
MFKRRYAQREAQLRRRCEEQLSGIEISDPYAVDEICSQLAISRQRPVYLHELPEVGGANAPCGIVLAFESEDHIFHVAATSQRHRAQIVRHELAHLLLGHAESGTVAESLLAVMPETIDPSAVVSALGRTSYETDLEYDAEVAATALGELFADLAHSGRGEGRPDAVARLDDALVHPRRNRRS